MQNIGERLEEARKRKGISIREAAEATKIRSDYLHKFENNQFDLDLADIYVRGFLRNYAVFLKVPADKIVNDYASLGRSESRPRQPSREIYGRMDVSVASVEERAAEKSGNEPQSAEPNRLPRGGSSLPKGPAIPPQLIFRGGIALGVIVVLLLLVWGIKALISDPTLPIDSNRITQSSASPVQTSSEPTITLIALDAVRVKIVQESNNQEIFQGTLTRGESRVFPKQGSVFITASAGENLEIEIHGKRYPMPFRGWERARVP